MSVTATFSQSRDERRTLVVVFLRGAADGLTLIAPLEDDNYHKFRPRLAVKHSEAVMLDGFFGMAPEMAPLEAAWKDGDLVIAHGVGGESDTRSHFEAQDLIERGGPVAGGWLGRFLRAREGQHSPLSAVALAPVMPEVLSGAPSAAAFQSLREFSFASGATESFPAALRRLYEAERGPLAEAAFNTFEAIRRIEAIDTKAAPAYGAEYDEQDDFSSGLRQLAQLIRADVGVDAASIDLHGWDTHFTQAALIPRLMTRLAKGLAAFRQDLGPHMATTTVVVMTEFGRRVAENTAFGTDHGRGSTLFLLGGGVKGGRIFAGPGGSAAWPGLREEMLEGPGDLPVWNNYRDILWPVLERHGASAAAMGEIFPMHRAAPLPVFS